MRNKAAIYIFWIGLFSIAGCKELPIEQQLKVFMEDPDNKIKQSITIGDVGIVTKFLPASYRSLMSKNNAIPDSKVDPFYYFNVKFNKKPGDKPEKEKLMYLNFDMQNDFVLLVNNRDSIAPAICQKIENGIAGCYEYMVVFEKGKDEWKDFTLVYHDKMFSIGTVSFVFNEKDILKIPGIKEKELK
jgi:hypothetical protein